MPVDVAALAPLVFTAVSAYHGLGVPHEDLLQEAWIAALTSSAAHDPRRHSCTFAAYVVTNVRRRLSRVCVVARRHHHADLPTGLVARDLTPVQQAALNERAAREGL